MRSCAAMAALLFAGCSEPHHPPAATTTPNDRLEWWREARFGLFVHWGLYAIPAGQWEGGTDHAEWIRDTARIPLHRYEALQEEWAPRDFDADAWASLAARAGMRYAVLTSKHHDGFCLFDSARTDWDVGGTQDGRDIVRAFAAACRRHGLRVGFYHSIMDWHHPDYLPRRPWETDRPVEGADFARYVDYLRGQVTELLTGYGPVDVMWFDGEWERTWTNALGRGLYELCRRLQPAVIVNNRVGKDRDGMAGMNAREGGLGDFGTPEQQVPAAGLPGVDWETCMTMNRHWGWNKADQDWKSPAELVRTLVDVASKGGNLLLNVGPMADGRFPPAAVERLEAIGRWMDVHGEAIHGSRASPFGALPFGRATWRPTRDGARLYLHVFEPPPHRELRVPGLGNAVLGAELLGGGHVVWRASPGELRLELPAGPLDPLCPVVAVDLQGEPIVYAPPVIDAPADEFVRELAVEVRASSPALDLRVTTDGSEPLPDSPPAGRLLRLLATTTVKARAFHQGAAVTPVVARTFERVAPWPAQPAPSRTAPGLPAPGLDCATCAGDFDRLPDFARLTDPAPAHAVLPVPAVADAPAREHVARRFTGCLRVPADDSYEFQLTSDDGARLSLDGKVVVDHDGLHAATTKVGHAPLAAGLHAFELLWCNRTGDAALRLRWAPLGKPPADVVPADFVH